MMRLLLLLLLLVAIVQLCFFVVSNKSIMKRLHISPVLGTMSFSAQTNKDTATAMMESFAKNGFQLIDTASMYCNGETEILIGNIFLERPNLRKLLTLHTKANPFTPQNGFTLSPESINRQLSSSLTSLGCMSVGLYYLHAPDVNNSLQNILATIQDAYTAGKFVQFGLSNYASWEVVFIYYYMKERGWIIPTIYQGMYNAITREVEADLLPALKRLNMSFYAYNPLAGGMLSGKHTKASAEKLEEGRFNKDSFWGQKYRERYMQDVQFDAVAVVQAACDRADISLSNASLRWLIHHSNLSAHRGDAVIIGASRMEHYLDNIVPFESTSADGKVCEEAAENRNVSGPLPSSILDAFEAAWQIIKAAGACPRYSRGVSKWEE